MSEPIRIESDRYTKVVASTVHKAFTDPDFLMTMRFSSLYQAEEFDNALVYSTWHFLFETGIAQMKDYVARLEDLVSQKAKEADEKKKIPKDQLERIGELIKRFKMYDDSKPVDSNQNIRIIRNYLRAYNEPLAYGTIMYDMHVALLNGRYAEKGGQGRKDVKDVTKTILQHGVDVQVGNGDAEKKGFLDRFRRN